MSDFEKKYYELLTATAHMRRLQKEYFRCRSSLILTQAKKAEAKVDSAIQEEINKTKEIKNLFN